jgi:hypothetical protein
VVGEDASLESLEGYAGFDPEVVHKRLACLPVGVERLGLPVGAVEGEHLLCAQSFSKRVLARELVELADQLLVATEREVAVDPVHERAHPQLIQQLDLVAAACLELEACQCAASPERKRLPGSGVGLTAEALARARASNCCMRVTTSSSGSTESR